MKRLRLILVLGLAAAGALRAQDAPSAAIPRDKFEGWLKVVKPYEGEFAWRDEIPWEITLAAAQEKAAAQDKPILLLRSNDGPPFGAV